MESFAELTLSRKGGRKDSATRDWTLVCRECSCQPHGRTAFPWGDAHKL